MSDNQINRSKKTLLFEKKWALFGIILLPLCITFTLVPFRSKQQNRTHVNETATHELSILFVGDVMQHLPQVEAAWSENTSNYLYDSCFSFIKPTLSNADICVANLETTLAGKPYSGYPTFSSPDQLATGLMNAGVDLVATANNHCCDRGKTGIERSIRVLDSIGLFHFGTYINEEVYRKTNPLIINTHGFKLAFFNYTFGTNGIPVPEKNIVSLIEHERITNDFKSLDNQLIDKKIVFIHWGDEYQRQPNAYQKEIALSLFEQGADIIIGSHPHVIQPMEWHKNESNVKNERLIVWSLGNFVSNQRKRYTDGGALFKITLQKTNSKCTIKNAEYELTWVQTPIENGRKKYYILPAAKFENDTIRLNEQEKSDLTQFLNDSRDLLNSYNQNIGEYK